MAAYAFPGFAVSILERPNAEVISSSRDWPDVWSLTILIEGRGNSLGRAIGLESQ
jgi:hypothetical protein